MHHDLRHLPDLRTLVCLLMLAGVGVLVAVGVLAVATALVVALGAGGGWTVAAAIAALGIVAAVGVRLLVARGRRRKPVVGVLVTPSEQPLLWVEIYRVAEGLLTRAPEELWLVPDASVTAAEHRTWLGLRPGVRRLSLGLPLLAGLTERQLRAVTTHECYRLWAPASPDRVVHRCRQLFRRAGRVVDRRGEASKLARVLGWYGRRYLALSASVARSQELEADRLSAELAGNGATMAALHELPFLSRGWAAFVNGYIEPAAALGRCPQDVLAGFASFMEHPDRGVQLVAQVAAPGSPQSWPQDSLLSQPDRLAAVESLPEDQMHDRSGPGIGLLRQTDQVIRGVWESRFPGSGFVPGTWAEIVPEAARAAACRDTLELARLGHQGGLGRTLSVTALVELIGFGLAGELVRPMLSGGAPGEAELQLAGRLVTGFLATAAIESGTASYGFSWAGPRLLLDEQGEADNLARVVDQALAGEGEVRALELWLESHRVDPGLEPGAVPGADRDRPRCVPAASPAASLNASPAASPAASATGLLP